MFERRVVVVLVVVVAAALGLLVRAGQVQIVEADQWRQIAREAMRRTEMTKSTRGRILDAKGRPLAEDVPCNDAAVAYWYVDGSYNDVTAATPGVARTRLYQDVAKPIARAATPGYLQLTRREQHLAVLASLPAAKQRVERMWDALAEAGGMTRADVDQVRQETVARVENLSVRVMKNRYRRAMRDHLDGREEAWWQRWLTGEGDGLPAAAEFREPVAEEQQAHPILTDISTETYNALGKAQDVMPGLVLQASRTRRYPAGPVAAHVVGRVGSVSREDLAGDPNTDDPLRAYLPRDVAGRSGLELAAEETLRGTRGRIDHDLEAGGTGTGGGQTLVSEPAPGRDVTCTIDLDLQQAVAEAFEHVQFQWPDQHDGRGKEWAEGPAPGAAVVIDVPSGAILAMVSAPTFDPNTYAEDFYDLVNDDVNRPLMNRAADFAAEPGSTVKPIVALGAVAQGLLRPRETIACDGYFHWHGTDYEESFRCWTASMFGRWEQAQGHQGGSDPHPTLGLNVGFTPLPGELTLADALQRSCNVFFEVCAARMGEAGVNRWFTAFGLGRPLEIGLSNKAGRLPRDMDERFRKNRNKADARVWMSGIGQGDVAATPLQMANVAATLARDGRFVTPSLLAENVAPALAAATDLGFDSEALTMLHRGMKAVVRTPGGSGHSVDAALPLEIAAKTGTAQAHPLTVARRDAYGEFVRGPDRRIVYDRLERSTRDAPNPDAPWYRRENDPAEKTAQQSHSWFVGYAPADDPKIAFAVLVEYGGSGGRGAGSVVPPLIEALCEYGYLTPTRQPDPAAPAGEKRYQTGPAWPPAADATPPATIPATGPAATTTPAPSPGW